MPSIKSPSDNVRVFLTHLGRDIIVTDKDKPMDFVHDPIRFQFRYIPSMADKGEKFSKDTDTSDGDLTIRIKDEYALLGPFTSWRIECWEHQDVDMSGVTEAYFEFRGSYYSF